MRQLNTMEKRQFYKLIYRFMVENNINECRLTNIIEHRLTVLLVSEEHREFCYGDEEGHFLKFFDLNLSWMCTKQGFEYWVEAQLDLSLYLYRFMSLKSYARNYIYELPERCDKRTLKNRLNKKIEDFFKNN